MKPLKKILFLITIVISFFISGCYTVLWTPEEQLPNETSYQPEPGYYIDDYYYYYDYPWWLTVRNPGNSANDNSSYNRDKDRNVNTLRNTGGGRGTEDTRKDILTPPPATINDNTNNNSNSNSNGNTEVRKTTGSTNTNSTNTGSNNSRPSSGNDSNSVRNSSGGRNNGGGRK